MRAEWVALRVQGRLYTETRDGQYDTRNVTSVNAGTSKVIIPLMSSVKWR